MDWEKMRNVDPRTVDRSKLVQRASVVIDPSADKAERIRSYVQQIKNPYCYLDGDIVVKLSFSETGRTIEDCVRGYLSGV